MTGAHCLFVSGVAGDRNDRILVVQHKDIRDPETGGSYTVKKYRSEKVSDGQGSWRHTKITLMPLNREFEPIPLTSDSGGDVRVVAELLEVLRREAESRDLPDATPFSQEL